MKTALQGYFSVLIVFFCILSSVYAQKEIDKRPFVLNANEVPVLGGQLNIYGLNFGTDPSVINVKIYDTSSDGKGSGFIHCTDVKVVLPNTIISCSIVDIGTGKPKHIEVTVNGLSNANSDDVNVAFKRSAPVLNAITYNEEDSEIKVYGYNFGFNPFLVSVTVGGFDCPVTATNDSVITCNKLVDNQLPGDGNTTVVSIVVDGQKTNANMSLLVEAVYLTNIDSNYLGDHIQSTDSTFGTTSITSLITRNIVFALIPGVAVVALIAFLVIRKRKRAFVSAQASKSAETQTGDSNAIIITTNMVRDSSMEEIDLNADDCSTVSMMKTTSEAGFYELSENQRTISSSSSSSFSSPYSSCTTTPSFCTPESMRRISPSSPSIIDTSSDYQHTSDHKRNKREKRMSSILNELPVSRLNKHSMDSPYFVKQNAFDSPLRTSCDSPVPPSPPSSSCDHQIRSSQEFSMNGLKTSQEINQRNTNPFDSPSVLHATIQRAALLRQQQQHSVINNNNPNNVPVALNLLKPKPHNKRRASLGAFQPTTRRSSLSTTSLHVSAMHSSLGMPEEDEEICTANSLRATQYIKPIIEESDA